MTTKEFIKMLQEEDPEGNGHLRLDGGIPRFAIAKEGYWDGSYAYLDEQGNYVTSIENYKVDIYCMDISDYVEEMYSKGKSWDEIKSQFKFKLGGYAIPSQREEKADKVLSKAKEAFDLMVKIDEDYIKTKTMTH